MNNLPCDCIENAPALYLKEHNISVECIIDEPYKYLVMYSIRFKRNDSIISILYPCYDAYIENFNSEMSEILFNVFTDYIHDKDSYKDFCRSSLFDGPDDTKAIYTLVKANNTNIRNFFTSIEIDDLCNLLKVDKEYTLETGILKYLNTLGISIDIKHTGDVNIENYYCNCYDVTINGQTINYIDYNIHNFSHNVIFDISDDVDIMTVIDDLFYTVYRIFNKYINKSHADYLKDYNTNPDSLIINFIDNIQYSCLDCKSLPRYYFNSMEFFNTSIEWCKKINDILLPEDIEKLSNYDL